MLNRAHRGHEQKLCLQASRTTGGWQLSAALHHATSIVVRMVDTRCHRTNTEIYAVNDIDFHPTIGRIWLQSGMYEQLRLRLASGHSLLKRLCLLLPKQHMLRHSSVRCLRTFATCGGDGTFVYWDKENRAQAEWKGSHKTSNRDQGSQRKATHRRVQTEDSASKPSTPVIIR